MNLDEILILLPQYMKENKLTQRELGQEIDASQQKVSDWLNKKLKPSKEYQEKLSLLLEEFSVEQNRKIVKEKEYGFKTIYNQLEKMDFTNFICSPLINGGPGLGKTSALTDERMYNLFKKKLHKPAPQILVIESRAVTRDQLRNKNVNNNYTFLQFAAASNTNLAGYDIIIVDEAHSLFSDAEFAPRTTAPLADWLRKSLCFQIYITASDVEFVEFANTYFDNKELQLTFPDLTEAHVRYTAKEMYLSISVEPVTKIIDRKAAQLFTPGNKGLFFIFTAKDVYRLFQQYQKVTGGRCGFYISQSNESELVTQEGAREEETEEEENWEDYTSRYVSVNILDYFKSLERDRKSAGKETVREALLQGHFPPDIDYVFMTAAGQEGLSLYDVDLDFVFIEDTYPLTINQKLFRYRNNVEKAYIHLPQRRIQRALMHTVKQFEEMRNASQEFLRGYYEGSKGSRMLSRMVWYDKIENKYKVAENYYVYILKKSGLYKEIKEHKDDERWLRANFGQFADKFTLVDAEEDRRKDILREYFQGKDGLLLTENLKKQMTSELKQLDLKNEKRNQDFTFDYVAKRCREYGICDFIKTPANKKDVANNAEVVYRKKYLRIKLS